jgi:hypothetical protein
MLETLAGSTVSSDPAHNRDENAATQKDEMLKGWRGFSASAFRYSAFSPRQAAALG